MRAYYLDHDCKGQTESLNCAPRHLELLSLSQVETEYGPMPVFEFHSGFWVNLHHTLYSLARERKASGTEKMLLETALLRA